MEQEGRPAARRERLWAFFELFALVGFVVAQPTLDSHHPPSRDDSLDPRRQPALGDNGELPETDQRAARG